MKKRISLLLPILLISIILNGKTKDLSPSPVKGDRVIKKNGFVVSFNEANRIPTYATYWLTAEKVYNAKFPREKKFREESSIETASDKDYKRSGFDKGHIVPAKDMAFSKDSEFDCFSYINIAPQNAPFNRGEWKRLEDAVRDFAVDDDSIFVVTGTIISKSKNTIGANSVAVPSYFYKAILDYKEPQIKAIAFIFPNKEVDGDIYQYACSIDDLEKRTGINFFKNISEPLQTKIEATFDIGKWNTRSKSKRGGSTHIKY